MDHSRDRRRNIIYQDNVFSFYVLYFLQGLPYSLQTRYLPLFLRTQGMALPYVGLCKLALLPWCLKAIWAPKTAKEGKTKREWLHFSLAGLTITCVVAAQYPPWHASYFVSVLILVLYTTFASLLSVVADSLTDEVCEMRRHSLLDHVQIAGNCSGGLTVGLLAWVTKMLTWHEVFYGLAIAYLFGLLIYSSIIVPRWFPPRLPTRNERGRRRCTTAHISTDSGQDVHFHWDRKQEHRTIDIAYTNELMRVNGSFWMLVLLLVYKIGEQGVMNLFPLYLLDNGHSLREVGLWTGLVAQFMSLVGSAIGTKVITRSLLWTLQVHLLIRSALIGAVWVAIASWRDFTTEWGLLHACSVGSFTALFLVSASMTSCSLKMALLVSQRAATHCRRDLFEVLITVELLGKVLFSSALGALAQMTGYVFVFGLFTAASILVIPLLLNAPTAVDV